MILFVRPKGLGLGLKNGMVRYLNSTWGGYCGTSTCWGTSAIADVIKTTSLTCAENLGSEDFLISWGYTGIVQTEATLVNPSIGVKRVSEKRGMRWLLSTSGNAVPLTVFDLSQATNADTRYPLVLRPTKHRAGRNLFVVRDYQHLVNVLHEHEHVFSNGWYASELIDKSAEFRVFIVAGRVVAVANKTPSDPTQVAWNVDQGGSFDSVRWGDWPMSVIKVAHEAYKVSGLDFGGIDVMVDREGHPYVCELNSAPALPNLSDGSVSYRTKCMAKAFYWMLQHGVEHMEPEHFNNWRGVIHPALLEYGT
jgi:hypothetical protein